MNGFLKSSLKVLSLGTLMFATCKQIVAQYGAPTDYLIGKLIRIVTENNEPIKGLKVSLYKKMDTSIHYTNKNGDVYFKTESDKKHKILIKDVDANKNLGNFPELNAIVNKRRETIVLKKDNK